MIHKKGLDYQVLLNTVTYERVLRDVRWNMEEG